MLIKLLLAVLGGLLLLGVACLKEETRLTDGECGGLAAAEILLGAATQAGFDVEIRDRLNEVYNDVQSIQLNHCWGEARAFTDAECVSLIWAEELLGAMGRTDIEADIRAAYVEASTSMGSMLANHCP